MQQIDLWRMGTEILDVHCTKDDSLSQLFLNGYKICLFENNIIYHERKAIIYEENIDENLLFKQLSGVVCVDEDLAKKIYKETTSKKVGIPKNLSLVSLANR